MVKSAIVYACDNNHIQNKLMRYSIDSLKKLNINLPVYILTLENNYLYSNSFNDCTIIKFSDILISKYFKNLKATKNLRVTKTTFCRLFIPLLLNVYTQVLYLDCDTYVQKDILDIFTKFTDAELYGANEDYEYTSTAYYITHKLKCINTLKNYINAGVILFNNTKILQKYQNYEKHLTYMFKMQNVFDFYNKDQDLINLCFNIDIFPQNYIQSVNIFNLNIVESAYILHFNQNNKDDILKKLNI